ITSGVIITTSRDREMIQGIVQFGLPYEFAFMTAVGIKFMPLLVEEFKVKMYYFYIRIFFKNCFKSPVGS
ncbi:MAG: hypothetical protein H0S78_13530, partial [Tissierellales bacterium]|nr:hypothetical protein [Tissierellales bacterium]